MAYAVKEIFYTLQGEGAQAGRAAVFLRFAGCNLWSGLEQDRQRGLGGCSRWCDTDFVGTDGTGGGKFSCAGTLAGAVAQAWGDRMGQRLVVCTGGEPLLQLDQELVDALHQEGFEVAIESNGTRLPPEDIDWISVSPKANTDLVLRRGNELKLVYPQQGIDPGVFESLQFTHFFLQPLDGPLRAKHSEECVRYCMAHPRWRVSLQMHKVLGIP